MSGMTQADRADRARTAWETYIAEFGGSEICDLVSDLLHLADIEGEEGGSWTLARAEIHYAAEHE
ncbi:hypothetical protein ABT390_33725 [Streptomyces aurantiacus]|uniref:hypothetical protein n=1 Tax=Streptomyces aurantiacus TaxID=47760 RepID=UPI00131A11A1|nr:hypothetical protein [Streptomyces aurantiacus]